MYVWDNDLGLFFYSHETKKGIEKLNLSEGEIKSLRHLNDKKTEEYEFSQKWSKKLEMLSKMRYHTEIESQISLENIKDYIHRFGLKQLTLEVTEECNFRCEFCIFSDYYTNTRNHSKKYMDFSVAKRAIDYYFSLLDKNFRYNPYRKPVIGFYGGEPLLNFELIKKSVEYITNKYTNDCEFIITTNGSLMDAKIAKWLMGYDFNILVSLNGPKNEHDRLRTYENGKGSFNRVMENIINITKENYKKISLAVVYDFNTDLFACEEFFSQDDIPNVSVASIVSEYPDSFYYDKFSEEDILLFAKNLKNARNNYFNYISTDNIKNKITLFDRLFTFPVHHDMNICNSLSSQSLIPYTGTCIPGRKLFVATNGDIHMCERVNHHFFIGNVECGLNLKKIQNLLNDYLDHMDKCSECEVSKMCNLCFVNFVSNKKISYSSEICKEKEKITKKFFVRNFEALETNRDLIESISLEDVYGVK